MTKSLKERQKEICAKFGTELYPCSMDLKIGISYNVRDRITPINGLRIKPEGDTTGWYIWAGKWSDDPSFFVPLHVVHLEKWIPLVLPYLRLPPGWRFLLTENYEDVWHDEEILKRS